MTPYFTICLKAGNKINILDLTRELSLDGYIPESAQATPGFKYSNTGTLNIIQQMKSSGAKVLDVIFTDHSESLLDEVDDYQLPQDGFYTVTHIILPTMEWLLDNPLTATYMNGIYVLDGETIRKFNNDLQEYDKTQEELIGELITIENTKYTTIAKLQREFFTTYNLKLCYIRECKLLLKNGCDCKAKNNSSLYFKRDFLWMTLNVIKFHCKVKEFAAAQLVLEEINYCNGLCKEDMIGKRTSSGCGCGK